MRTPHARDVRPEVRSVSVVIPVKDDERVARCVASVRRATEGLEAQVIVVANGSSPGFEEWLAGLEGIELLTLPEPNAYVARNAGVDHGTGDTLFFTDADCLVAPGWLREGIEAAMQDGIDLVQGFSGSVDDDRRSRLIQRRYEAHLRRLRPGDPTETDTRNLAVRRYVFDRLRFSEAWRRSCDTEFGLLAERHGFRVSYAPAMRVDHVHEASLGLYLAKQVCHGWGSRRIMAQHPGLPWHSGTLRLAARLGGMLGRLPGSVWPGRMLGRVVVFAGYGLDRARLPYAPLWLGSGLIATLESLAALAGQLTYRDGGDEPLLSEVAGRNLARE